MILSRHGRLNQRTCLRARAVTKPVRTRVERSSRPTSALLGARGQWLGVSARGVMEGGATGTASGTMGGTSEPC